MRIFVIADIHGNWPALQAVLADFGRLGARFAPADPAADRLICLGDVIGYYAHPNEVMDRVWEMTEEILIGNHEISIYETMHSLQREDVIQWGIHPHAAWAFKWTAEHLNDRNRQRLDHLMRRRQYLIEDFDRHALFAHAAPCMPELMDYITSASEAYFRFFEPPECHCFKVAFVGHSHVPQFYQHQSPPEGQPPAVNGGIVRFYPAGALSNPETAPSAAVRDLLCCEAAESGRFEKTWHLDDAWRTLVCVPSVGQPRDGLPCAGYALFDTQASSVTMVRLPYNIAAAVEAMQALPGCPETLITRLTVGR